MDKNVTNARQQRIQELNYAFDDQPKRTITECNICGSRKWIEICHKDRYGFSVKACACLQCGLVFLNPLLTNDGYQYFYQSIYRKLVSAYHGRIIDAISIQAEQREYAVELEDFIAQDVSLLKGKTLLDIGGSTGVVSLHLKNVFGLQPLVLDPSPDEIQQAQKLGLETQIGVLEDYSPGEKVFDLIVLCQTIDHLIDVRSCLAKIRTLMGEESLLFVDIVDFRAAYLRNWSINEAIKIDHPYYFTEDSTAVALKRAGFEIIRVRYAKDKLHIGYLCKISMPEPNYVPAQEHLDMLWRELRFVQNAPGIASG